VNVAGSLLITLIAFLVFAVIYLAVIIGVGYAMVWVLTPVAYKRWKQLKAQDEARESAGR